MNDVGSNRWIVTIRHGDGSTTSHKIAGGHTENMVRRGENHWLADDESIASVVLMSSREIRELDEVTR